MKSHWMPWGQQRFHGLQWSFWVSLATPATNSHLSTHPGPFGQCPVSGTPMVQLKCGVAHQTPQQNVCSWTCRPDRKSPSKNKTEPNAIYSAIGFLHPGKKNHQTQSSNQRKTSFWKKKDTWNYQVVGKLNSQFLNFLPPIQCQIINAKYGCHHRFTTNLLRSGSWEHSHWKLQVLTIGRPRGAAQFLATAADKGLNCQKLGSRDDDKWH